MYLKKFLFLIAAPVPALPPDPVGNRVEEPPAGGGPPPPSSINDPEASNSSPEHQPADSWEEAAVDDPLITPENEEVFIVFKFKKIIIKQN